MKDNKEDFYSFNQEFYLDLINDEELEDKILEDNTENIVRLMNDYFLFRRDKCKDKTPEDILRETLNYVFKLKVYFKFPWGELFSTEDFIKKVKDGSITPNDGEGDLISPWGELAEDVKFDPQWLSEKSKIRPLVLWNNR